MTNNLANPAPLGLSAFGMSTILLNLHNAGLFGMESGILAMGIFYGGLVQLIVGIMEFKKGNTFGTTVFGSYGAFWLTLVYIIYFNGKLGIPANSEAFMTSYLFVWGVFTCFLWIGTWKSSRVLQFVFLSATALFWMLAARDGFGWTGTWAVATGYLGIVCGASSLYCGLAQVLNENFGRVVLPLGDK
jgi:uncharacterized protein